MQPESENLGDRGAHGTVLESVAAIREQYQRSTSPPVDQPIDRSQESFPSENTARYRPSERAAIPLLTVLDDGKDEGEVIRVRHSPFVIGRNNGDLKIGVDLQMSARHAELVNREQAGGWGWFLRDLGSTNGTFVCVSSSLLQPGQVIMLGEHRFVFELGTNPTEAAQELSTSKWEQPHRANVAASLTEMSSGGQGVKYPITKSETLIGRDREKCAIVLDDPMVCSCHARITRDTRGRWTIQNLKSLNGVWLKINEVPLGKGGYFQLGEQRFAIRIG